MLARNYADQGWLGETLYHTGKCGEGVRDSLVRILWDGGIGIVRRQHPVPHRPAQHLRLGGSRLRRPVPRRLEQGCNGLSAPQGVGLHARTLPRLQLPLAPRAPESVHQPASAFIGV